MERFFISQRSRHSNFDLLVMQVPFRICVLIWRENIYVSRQGKSINRRKESTKKQLLCNISETTDDNTRYNFIFVH